MTLRKRHTEAYSLTIGVLLLVFLTGCAGDLKSKKPDPFFEKWGTMAEASRGYSPADRQKVIELPTPPDKKVHLAALMGDKPQKFPTKPITLTMRQADLKAVLRAMAKAVNTNILIKNDLKGDVSVDFRSVPWDQAFTGLLKTHGLTYVWEGSIIRVVTIEDIEHELKQKAQLREVQLLDPLITIVVPIDYAIDDEVSASSISQSSGSSGSMNPKTTKGIILKKNIEALLSKSKDGQRGSVLLDPNSNSLIISAIEQDIIKIKKVLDIIDKPRPQILIKANIVETSKQVARDLGIKWGGYSKGTLRGNESLIVTGGGGVPTGGIGEQGFGVNFPAGSAGSGILDPTTGPLGTLGLMFGVIGGNLLEIELQALQEDSKLNILSSPSITTLDNITAYTENGERVPYVTQSSSSTAQNPQYETKFEDVVLRLEITPHVIDGKGLKMKISVKKDEVDFSRQSRMGDPYIIKKTTETVLIVQDGETIVISGLTKQRHMAGDSGWPGLKDVPVLGWLFKADSRSEDMEEVLIFITPHILKVAGTDEPYLSGLQQGPVPGQESVN
ncbi:MAG: type IV pilus secretin PilQ [Smithella sp.]|nr:type IV pilus secretin PilQ [Smithella sp.]